MTGHRGHEDLLFVGVLVLGALLVGTGAVVHVSVVVACLIAGLGPPPVTWSDTLAAVAASPLDPLGGYPAPRNELPPRFLVGVVAAGLTAVTTAPVALVRRRRGGSGRRAGFASPDALTGALGVRARRRTVHVIRPSLAGSRHPATAELGIAFGSEVSSTRLLLGSHEDSVIVLGPPRMGKTRSLAAPWIVDSPGPVVATSTKTDLLRLTAPARKRVLAWDPEGLAGWPGRLRWSPVAGCAEPATAIRRADALVAARPLGEQSGSDAAFFAGAASTVLRCQLHAAALSGRSMADVTAWAADFADDTPREILRSEPGAQAGWADELVSYTTGSPETVASTRMTLGLVLQALADPAVLADCCPGNGEGLDLDAFVDGDTASTLHVLSGRQARSTAPLATALVDEVVAAARRASQQRVGGRLDPPLRLVLDEAANVCPLPCLPDLLSDAGGRGLTACVFLQSLAQARARWGRDGAAALWAASTAKIVLGGLTDPQDLEDLSRLCGERDIPHHTRTVGPDGQASRSATTRRERVLDPSDIRQLPVGRALLLYRTLPPAILRLDRGRP